MADNRARYSGVIAALLAFSGSGERAQAQETPASATSRLKEIHRTVMDPQQVFSISKTLAELEKLETRLETGDKAERGRLLYLRAFILARAGRSEEALPPGIEALAINDASPFMTEPERTRFLYNVASQAEFAGKCEVAIGYYRKVIPLLKASAEFTEDQRLGTRERLGYCLHEAGNYKEALAVNRELLVEGEKLFGAGSDKLLVVITNIAQNAHADGNPALARTFLDRRLEIATRNENQRHIDDALFQLGVLAFEQNNPAEAEAFMKRRLQLAQQSGDKSRISAASEDIDILYEKMGKPFQRLLNP